MNQFGNTFPQPPIIGAPGATVPLTPGAVHTPAPQGGSGVARATKDIVQNRVEKGLAIRPLGLIVDGNESYRYEFDPQHTELEDFIKDWQLENTKVDKVTNKRVSKTITPIRAVKELCVKHGRNPLEFVKVEDGKPVLKVKKSSIKGYIMKFPSTEGSETYVDIVKKSALSQAISNAGGFQLAGTIKESALKPEELDIPVALVMTATGRRVTDSAGRSEQKSILRTSAHMPKDLIKKFYPDKNNPSTLDMFKLFPFDQYKYVRVVPLKLYKTEMVDGKPVCVLDLDPNKRLAQYESYENPLEQEEYGAGLMKAIGKSAAELQAAFMRKAASQSNETEADLVGLVVKSYVGAGADQTITEKYVNDLLNSQF